MTRYKQFKVNKTATNNKVKFTREKFIDDFNHFIFSRRLDKK